MARSTFVDANVLIAAHRGAREWRNRALDILEDPNRSFIASPFLRLETIPQAIYHKQALEAEFYRTFFDGVRIWITDLHAVVTIAEEESKRHGIAAMDAIHLAVAFLGEAEVFYTLERTEKPIYRTTLVRVERI